MKAIKPMTIAHRQRGVVLVVALIMLVLVTLMGTVSSNLVLTNLQIVQNVEARSAARSAALTALQEALTTPGFIEGNKAFVVGCNDDSYTRCLDLDGDNLQDDVTITLTTPVCISASPVKNSDLDVFNNADDASCYQPGLYSLCADALWEVTATAEDAITGARVEIRQGVQTRTTTNLLATAC